MLPGKRSRFRGETLGWLGRRQGGARVGESAGFLGAFGGDGMKGKIEFNGKGEGVWWLADQVGGAGGAERLGKSKVLKKLLKEQKESGRIYGGICSAPAILQKHGLLKDKIATAHPSVINKLTGQVADGAGIVIDGNIITCQGLGTVMDFSMNIVHKLFGHGRTRSLAEDADHIVAEPNLHRTNFGQSNAMEPCEVI
ncbi:Protein DJ-1 like C [Dendrobium catenatum]|uniref:Protein DJ-1 like C n=1 Tax=Dendrobium catenatum TaxID=906689 RepID=A0A2I0VW67_9ASPA|nr:Protein DJ-1 like C [Dendrobium catenatum]